MSNAHFAVIANLPGSDAYVYQTADGSWSEPCATIVDAMAVAPRHSYAEATTRAMVANQSPRKTGFGGLRMPRAIAWAGVK